MDDILTLARLTKSAPWVAHNAEEVVMFIQELADEIERLRNSQAPGDGAVRLAGHDNRGGPADEAEPSPGGEPSPNCTRCGGSGGILEHGTEYPSGQIWGDCPDCGGTGRSPIAPPSEES